MSWAIADPETDELLGHISLIGSGGNLTDSAALGYWTHPAARRTGVMTAAALAVVAEALSPATDGGGGMRRLTLVVAVGNIASHRIVEAAGFQRTGRRRESDLLISGTYTDELPTTCLPRTWSPRTLADRSAPDARRSAPCSAPLSGGVARRGTWCAHHHSPSRTGMAGCGAGPGRLVGVAGADHHGR